MSGVAMTFKLIVILAFKPSHEVSFGAQMTFMLACVAFKPFRF